MAITVSQSNPVALTRAHPVTHPVIKPVPAGGLLEEFPLTTTIHELLLKVTKGDATYWIGAAVPFGTTDFSKAQVFFHPAVVQARRAPHPPVVHALDLDYPSFGGGWSGSLQRYVALQGGQLAAARRVPLLVPFTTMVALAPGGAQNMFTADPVATLSHVLAAVRTALIPEPSSSLPPVPPLPPQDLTDVGVTSFGSGILALRRFITAMKPSGLVREVIDLDSPYNPQEPAALTPSPGAVSHCYTQRGRPDPPPGYRYLPASGFARLTSYGGNPHLCIGWMMYHTAMVSSVIT
ncbi:hypothetical protein ACWF94_25020 [Streptomyces sp. NPDC055078]